MDDLDDQLARYRPVGPPEDLRARVVMAARVPASRRWVWLPPAAAAAAAAMFYVMAAGARRDLVAELTTNDPHRDAMVRALAADLGGDEEAGRLAARLIEMNEEMAAEGNLGSPLDVEGNRHD